MASICVGWGAAAALYELLLDEDELGAEEELEEDDELKTLLDEFDELLDELLGATDELLEDDALGAEDELDEDDGLLDELLLDDELLGALDELLDDDELGAEDELDEDDGLEELLDELGELLDDELLDDDELDEELLLELLGDELDEEELLDELDELDEAAHVSVVVEQTPKNGSIVRFHAPANAGYVSQTAKKFDAGALAGPQIAPGTKLPGPNSQNPLVPVAAVVGTLGGGAIGITLAF
ncbi:MAG TPA: hypothetical protein VHX86_14595 [Tepidisphaeraceae bacterium]|nr:hypothetical protein [Tepidisphaeraceae bacterium]